MNFNQYVKNNTLEVSDTTVNIIELVDFLKDNTHIKKLVLTCLDINEGIKELAQLHILLHLI